MLPAENVRRRFGVPRNTHEVSLFFSEPQSKRCYPRNIRQTQNRSRLMPMPRALHAAGRRLAGRLAVADRFPRRVFVLFQSHEIRRTEGLFPLFACPADNALQFSEASNRPRLGSSSQFVSMTRIVLPVMQPSRTSPSTYMSAIPGCMGFGSPTTKHSVCFGFEGKGSFGGFAPLEQQGLEARLSDRPTA